MQRHPQYLVNYPKLLVGAACAHYTTSLPREEGGPVARPRSRCNRGAPVTLHVLLSPMALVATAGRGDGDGDKRGNGPGPQC